MMMMSAALLLTSCGLYNKYERPDVNTTGLIRDAVSDIDTLAVQDTASFGNLPWRSVFTDPQLQQLIEQGLAKNADLLADGLYLYGAYRPVFYRQVVFIPCYCNMDARPLRQCPVAEALYADEAARYERLSDGCPCTDYRRHC